jgi:hypothetical protein
MKTRVVVMGAVAAGLLVAGGQGAASANVVWCAGDPPIHVVTPGGNNLEVNNVIYLPVEDRHLAKQIVDGATAVPDGHGGTFITVHVSIPQGAHGATVVSINHRFNVSDTKDTPGGGVVLTLMLDLPLA